MTHNSHEFADFMRKATREMADEYDRIQKGAQEDPGTAGDNILKREGA